MNRSGILTHPLFKYYFVIAIIPPGFIVGLGQPYSTSSSLGCPEDYNTKIDNRLILKIA